MHALRTYSVLVLNKQIYAELWTTKFSVEQTWIFAGKNIYGNLIFSSNIFFHLDVFYQPSAGLLSAFIHFASLVCPDGTFIVCPEGTFRVCPDGSCETWPDGTDWPPSCNF